MAKADFFVLLATITVNALASLLIKKGASAITLAQKADSSITLSKAMTQAVNGYTITGLALLGLSFVVFIYILSKVSVSVAQPMLGGAYILVAIGGYLFFGETLSLAQIIGIAVIILGIFLVSGGIK